MKIVQLVTRNCVGGVQVVAHALNDGFRAAGHDASIWFFCDTEEETIATPYATSLCATRSETFYYPRLIDKLWAQLISDKPDSVLAHTTNTAVPGLLLAAMAGIPRRIAVQHNPLNTYSLVARSADRIAADLGIYTRNVAVSQTVRRTMTHYSDQALGRVRTIHNGLRRPNLPRTPVASEREAACERFSLPLERSLIVTAGRLALQKNQAVLVEAMRLLSGAVLVVVGNGPLRDELRSQIASADLEDRVRMLGALGPHDVRLLLRVCDLFVSPSSFEAMPMVVLEAMQEGAAILASDIDAHRELLGEEASLVTPSPEKLAASMKHLLEDSVLRTRLSRSASERAKNYSEEAMVRGYLHLLADDHL